VALVWAWRPEGSPQTHPVYVAAAAMALSPFAISFSSTAFLDPLMVMFVLAALVAAARKHFVWAGIWLGLAAATKVQALVFFAADRSLRGVGRSCFFRRYPIRSWACPFQPASSSRGIGSAAACRSGLSRRSTMVASGLYMLAK